MGFEVTDEMVEAYLSALNAQPVLREPGNHKVRIKKALEAVYPLIAKAAKAEMRVEAKPLNWPDRDPRDGRLRSFGGLVRYSIAFCGMDDQGEIGKQVFRWAREGCSWSDAFYDIDAAKAACQSNYNSRIAAAIRAMEV